MTHRLVRILASFLVFSQSIFSSYSKSAFSKLSCSTTAAHYEKQGLAAAGRAAPLSLSHHDIKCYASGRCFNLASQDLAFRYIMILCRLCNLTAIHPPSVRHLSGSRPHLEGGLGDAALRLLHGIPRDERQQHRRQRDDHKWPAPAP